MRNKIFYLVTALIVYGCSNEESDVLKELPGTWVWISSCGGFTGACDYPDDQNYKSIVITEDRFIKEVNGEVTIDNTYQITYLEVHTPNYPYMKDYELTLGDGQIIQFTFFQDTDRLFVGNVEGSFLIDTYKRAD